MTSAAGSTRRRRDGERGAAIIEFSLMSIVFFMVIFGITEFGRMIFNYNIMSQVAREGARYASVRGQTSGHVASASDVQTYVASRSLGLLSADNVTVTWHPANKAAGGTVTVTTTYSFASAVPLVSQASGTLSSTSAMTVVR